MDTDDRIIEPVLSGKSEAQLEQSLRPQTFDGFIGQRNHFSFSRGLHLLRVTS